MARIGYMSLAFARESYGVKIWTVVYPNGTRNEEEGELLHVLNELGHFGWKSSFEYGNKIYLMKDAYED